MSNDLFSVCSSSCCSRNNSHALGRRKRQRRMGQRSALVVATALVVCMSTTTTSAFVPPQAALVSYRPTGTSTMTMTQKSSSLWQVAVPQSHPGEDDDDDNASGWLSWMARGRKKGVSDVKMREAEELGGVPRSDRYSSSDWLHNTASLPSSAILRAIKGPVTFMTTWATLLSIAYMRVLKNNPYLAETMTLPQSPHSLMVSSLSLLLVFKTNSAYQRFAEGRKIWEYIINGSRDLYRMMNLYENEMGRSKRRRLQRLLAAFPYLLRHRIRPNLVMYRLDDVENVRDPDNSILLYQDKAADDLDPEAAAVATQEENEGNSRRKTRPLFWVDKRTLPWRLLPPNALEPCARAQNRPLWVCDRMAQEIRNIPDGPNFTARERLVLISKVEKLSGCIGACERIHQTAVPLNYARHSLRALTLWLFTLPFALVSSLKYVTGPVLFLVSWLLFGVYEIGYSIEDPFQGTLRLSVLCDTIRRDVLADEVTRSTAFEAFEDDTAPPSATANNEDNDDVDYASSLVRKSDYSVQPLQVEEEDATKTVEDATKTVGSRRSKPKRLRCNVDDVGGDDEEEDRDYESSPISRETPQEEEDQADHSSSNNSSSNLSSKSSPVEVEELPSIPIIRNLNTSEMLYNKKP